MPLPDKATAEEARSEAGFIVGHWDLFIVKLSCSLARAVSDHDQEITGDKATKLRESDPNITWQSIRDEVRNQIIEDVNTQLEDEGIPPVGLDVFKWRMQKALNNRKREGTYSPTPLCGWN
jgi:hypothetical protein